MYVHFFKILDKSICSFVLSIICILFIINQVILVQTIIFAQGSFVYVILVFLFRLLLIYNQDMILLVHSPYKSYLICLIFYDFDQVTCFLFLWCLGSQEDQRCDQENMLPLTLQGSSLVVQAMDFKCLVQQFALHQ